MRAPNTQVSQGQCWDGCPSTHALQMHAPYCSMPTPDSAARLVPPLQLMGAVGAMGFTPLCLVLPVMLFLMARGGQLAAWQRWGLARLAATFSGVGIQAAGRCSFDCCGHPAARHLLLAFLKTVVNCK